MLHSQGVYLKVVHDAHFKWCMLDFNSTITLIKQTDRLTHTYVHYTNTCTDKQSHVRTIYRYIYTYWYVLIQAVLHKMGNNCKT